MLRLCPKYHICICMGSESTFPGYSVPADTDDAKSWTQTEATKSKKKKSSNTRTWKEEKTEKKTKWRIWVGFWDAAQWWNGDLAQTEKGEVSKEKQVVIPVSAQTGNRGEGKISEHTKRHLCCECKEFHLPKLLLSVLLPVMHHLNLTDIKLFTVFFFLLLVLYLY